MLGSSRPAAGAARSAAQLRGGSSATTARPWGGHGPPPAPRAQCAARAAVASPEIVATSDVKVRWQLHHHCDFGQHVAIVGGHAKLGDWQPGQAVRMTWTDGDQWVGEATFGTGTHLEYKYVVRTASGNLVYWRDGSNVCLDVAPMPGANMRVLDSWSNDKERLIEVQNSTGKPAPSAPAPQMPSMQAAPAPPQMAAPAPPSPPVPIEDPIAQATTSSMSELREVMRIHGEIQTRANDPTAQEVLLADRVLAAANNKAVAMGRALKAARAFPQLPAGKPSKPPE